MATSSTHVQSILESCVDCGLCSKECAFLHEYGTPINQIMGFDPALPDHQFRPFLCNLCGLCGNVCPKDLDPLSMFLDMRRLSIKAKGGEFKEHGGIINYEKTGTSKRMTWYGLPENCDTVLFPGCTLPGTRPGNTIKLYRHLKQTIPQLGIVLDCCTKPSHDLGRTDHFESLFGEMKRYLLDCGITTILVACPSCFKIFETYGSPLQVQMVYELMAMADRLPGGGSLDKLVTVHDPCILRHNSQSQDAVRNIIRHHGLSIREMKHSKSDTVCCGEGGAVSFFSQDLSSNWGHIRKKEAQQERVISYCAGCTNYLSRIVPCDHVIDLYFNPEKTLNGNAAVAKAPLTYLNRITLKKKLQKEVIAKNERERPTVMENNQKKSKLLKRLIIIAALVALFFVLRHSGIRELFQGDNLNQLISSYGMLAPIVFMLFYTVAPVMFLPGLPLTIAGGVLFGPFWGVVYSIIGATLGASLSFLISRYVARDLIMSKLTHPRWQKLDKDVETHGWKVVALTRLIPLFPFNLLNYAFGLTSIGFIPYALASFICMLPACIAFIVFSSSFTDLIGGKIPPEFIVGILLIIAVSLLPLIYKRLKKKPDDDTQTN